MVQSVPRHRRLQLLEFKPVLFVRLDHLVHHREPHNFVLKLSPGFRLLIDMTKYAKLVMGNIEIRYEQQDCISFKSLNTNPVGAYLKGQQIILQVDQVPQYSLVVQMGRRLKQTHERLEVVDVFLLICSFCTKRRSHSVLTRSFMFLVMVPIF